MTPAPTKFKETEMGLIPEEWEVLPIAKLPIKIGDGNYSSKYPKMQELVSVGIPFISAKDIKDGRIRSDELRFISPELHSTLTKGHIKSGDTLIVTRADVGRVGLVTEEFEDANINAQLVFLRPNETTVDKVFLYYLLSSSSYFDLLRNFSSGSAQSQLPIKAVNEITIILPAIIEQKQIAEILSSLDDKIELNRKINANLEKLASSLFKKWFVDIGDELPEGWRIGKFSEIAEITSGKRPIDNQDTQTNEFKIPLLGASSVMGYVKEALYKEPILVTGRVGTHGIIQKVDYPCWPSDNTLVIKSKYLEFAYQTMKSFDFASLNRGSTQPLITQGDLKNIEIRVPIETVLKEFETAVAPFAELVRDNEKENYNLSQIRDSLLSRLMSGKIRV